jgi:hypothetical protein
LNLQLQRQRCSRLERFFKVEEKFVVKSRKTTRIFAKVLEKAKISLMRPGCTA